MKFKHVSIHNIRHLVPRWLMDPLVLAKKIDEVLDTLYRQMPALKPRSPFEMVGYWIEIDTTVMPIASLRLVLPDETIDLRGHLLIAGTSLMGNRCQVDLPINSILKGSDPAQDRHTLYLHGIQTDVPLGYFGITRKPWYERWSQHVQSARNDSQLVFHRALRAHQHVPITHRVVLTAIHEEYALRTEEEMVENLTLYPLGLNMIPGGRAGFRYLSQLGHAAIRDAAQRDAVVETLAAQSHLAGHPNPLCAARWASDADYAERVICGHSGRLSAEQVRAVRGFAAIGRTAAQIQDIIGSASRRQIDNVLRGATYGRIS